MQNRYHAENALCGFLGCLYFILRCADKRYSLGFGGKYLEIARRAASLFIAFIFFAISVKYIIILVK